MQKDYIYIAAIVILLISIIVLTIIILNYKKKIQIYMEKKEAIENQYYMQLKHYEKYISNYDKYRKFKHDIKNHLIILDILMNKKEYGKVKEYLNTIEEELENMSVLNYTNNLIIDLILYNINEICKIKAIEFKAKASINDENTKIEDFSEFLIYSLYEFIEIVENEENRREIVCEIKENENNLALYLETVAINNYNNFLINKIEKKLKGKAENLNFNIELKDNKLILKCLL